MPRTIRRSFVLLAALSFAWAGGVTAQGASDEKKPKKAKAQHEETDEPATADDAAAHKGMQAYVDPDNGRLRRPTPAEERKLAEELAALVNESAEGLKTVTMPNGTVAVDLEQRFMNLSIATVGSDGKLELSCATTAREALELMLKDPAARKAQVRVVTPAQEKKEVLDVR